MAKQTGKIKYCGTSGSVCFYRMQGEYYARMKSSLTGKRVKKDPAFRQTMVYAALLKSASPLASAVYQQRPAGIKDRRLYQSLTGTAMRLLKNGVSAEEVLQVLAMELAASLPQQAVAKLISARVNKPVTKKESRLLFAEVVLSQVFQATDLFQRTDEEPVTQPCWL